MTVQELIGKLSDVIDKNLEVKFVSNQTLEDLVVVDIIPDAYECTVYLEFK